jgi:hypothetical protein
MYSDRSTRALPRAGFPIRKSSDQRMVSSFPRLIAAAHVLHRLLAPRHPPCALSLLTRKNTFLLPLWSFQGARGAGSKRGIHEKTRPQPIGSARSLKTQQRRRRDRRFSRRVADPDGPKAITGTTPARVIALAFPRKEVIQPQLPLRLPCYDFTPIINPTFDGCLLRRG